MNKHMKKIIAPVVITVLVLLYLAAYGLGLLKAVQLSPMFLLLVIPLVLMGGGIVYVLIERIREIKKGEEDDLDNY